MAERDIWRQIAKLTGDQLATLRLFLFPGDKSAKKSIKSKDQKKKDEKDTD